MLGGALRLASGPFDAVLKSMNFTVPGERPEISPSLTDRGPGSSQTTRSDGLSASFALSFAFLICRISGNLRVPRDDSEETSARWSLGASDGVRRLASAAFSSGRAHTDAGDEGEVAYESDCS